jgi:DNA polymerase elongation subunit (family B)
MTTNITFQIVDIDAKDEYDLYGEKKQYSIHLFGKTLSGDSVHVKVNDFHPYFFIKVPDTFSITKLKNELEEKIRFYKDDKRNTLEIVKRMDYYGFNHYKKDTFVKLTFGSYSLFNDTKSILSGKKTVWDDGKPSEKSIKPLSLGFHVSLYESKLTPFFRFLHEQKIQPAGWATVSNYTECSISKCKIDIQSSFKNVIPADMGNQVAPFIQASFDIECYSGDHIRIPDPEMDEDTVTQIGTTVSTFGKAGVITSKHIITLKSCDDIPGAIVESYETEEEVLIAWIQYINNLDPDVITGYNIYGFDFKYLYKRAQKLNILQDFANTSRYKKFSSSLKNKTLSSSALGFNEMHYMDSPGRLLIDLYKVVQRDYKFESYKLDNVASEFIRGKITKCVAKERSTFLTVNSVESLEEGQYISILIDKLSPYEHSDKYKFKIRKIQADKIIVEGSLDTLQKFIETRGVIEWTLKKDDIKVSEIFSFQNQTSDKRAIVAKYCFVEGTRVSLPSCSVDIKSLEHMNTDVVTWVENGGFSTSEKTHFFNNGQQDCIQLTFMDGTKISCTKDHQILTKNGWIEAQHLTEQDNVLFNPEPALVNYNEEYTQTFNFSDEIGTLKYNEACILSRIIGYLTTDGGIYKSSCYKNYVQGVTKYTYNSGKLFMGTMIDAKSIQKDIHTLTGQLPAIRETSRTFDIVLPMKLTKMILSIDGIDVGQRMNSPSGMPSFIKTPECPLWIIREFLKGLMGGDGHSPCLSADKFSSVGFGQSKTREYLDDLSVYMNDLQSLFEKFGINSVIQNVKKNKSGNGYTQNVMIKQEDLIEYYEKIGYAYCASKTYRLGIAASYYKLRQETTRQFQQVCNRVLELRKTGMQINHAVAMAHGELKTNEPIFNKHYSLPGKGQVNMNHNYKPTNSKFKKEHFPSATEYTKMIGAYDRFTSLSNSKSHVVKRNDIYSPCYYMSIIDKKSIGMQNVYDIEVKDTHNFVANGAVVHNCIQDNVLCNILLDKLQVLANTIGMANVCYVPMSFLFLRGQGIKAYSLIAKQCMEDGYLIPDTERKDGSDEFQGATVLDAKVGGYFDPVVCNDFASLYPSSIISHNLSPDTLIVNKHKDYSDIELNDIRIDDTTVYSFVKPGEITGDQKETDRPGRGIIPRVLMNLLASRKATKKLMAAETDPFSKFILEGLQLSYKLTANSVYGALGASFGSCACKPAAAACTAVGRQMLQFAASQVSELYPESELIYGDSVMPDTPVIVKDKETGQIYIKEIQELSTEWNNYNEFKNPEIVPILKQLIENSLKTVYAEYNPINVVLLESGLIKPKRNRGNKLTTITYDIMEDNYGKYCKVYINDKYTLIDYSDLDILDNYSIFIQPDKTTHYITYYDTDDHKIKKLHNLIMNKFITQLPRGYRQAIQTDRIIDHINGNGFDNRKANLRYVNVMENQYYKKVQSNNSTGIKGVYERKCGGYRGSVAKMNGKRSEIISNDINVCINYVNNKTYDFETELQQKQQSFINELFNKLDGDYNSNRQFKEQANASKYQVLSTKHFVDIEKVIRHKTLKKIYRITTNTSTIDITEDHSLIGSNNKVLKPSDCKIGTKILINKKVFQLLRNKTINYDNKDIETKFNIFLKNELNDNEIVGIEILQEQYTDFVYDIQTANNRFCAGIGNIVSFNTDSIMVRYLKTPENATKEQRIEVLRNSIKCGEHVEQIVSSKLPYPHTLEYEKVYYPYILYSKKRYSGVMYDFNPEKFKKIDNKGIVLQRRDNARIVKYIFQGALESILFDQDPKKACTFVEKSIKELCSGKFPQEFLTVTKAYKKTATEEHNDTVLKLRRQIGIDPTNKEVQAKLRVMGQLKTELPHIMLVRRRKARGDSSIKYNDRIPFIYIQLSKAEELACMQASGKDKLAQGDHVEDPEYITEHNLKIDYCHYISNQIMKPLLQLLAIFEEDTQETLGMDDPDKILSYKEKMVTKRLFNPLLQAEKLKARGIKPITDYFTKKM